MLSKCGKTQFRHVNSLVNQRAKSHLFWYEITHGLPIDWANNFTTVHSVVRLLWSPVKNGKSSICDASHETSLRSRRSKCSFLREFRQYLMNAWFLLISHTLGQKSTFYPKIHILKIPIFTRFTYLKYHFSQNSHFWNLIF